MTTGEFFSFMTALFMLYGPIKRISSIHNQIQDAVAAAERIFAIIDLTPAIRGGDKKVGEAKELVFEDVSLRYGDKEALKEINFSAQKGTITALVGESGSGKSSIASLILRFYDPTSGRILLDGTDLREYDLVDLRRHIGYVTQRIYLFAATIAQNVAGSDEFDRERVIEALRRANAYDFVAALPQGIDTPLAEAGANLSGGQRQRLAIARALYKDAKILIFDEATSALDAKSEEQVLSTIRSVARDRIVILISHNLPAVTFAHQIILLQKGSILCKGRHGELMERCEAYRRLYNKL